MSNYIFKASGKARHFTITGGLVEGYDIPMWNRHIHSLYDVTKAHHAWQQHTGTVQELAITQTMLSYGSVKADGVVMAGEEPGFIASGAINVLYSADLSDDAALARITDLACWLARALHQERIYFSWDGTDYILDRADDHKQPATHQVGGDRL